MAPSQIPLVNVQIEGNPTKKMVNTDQQTIPYPIVPLNPL